MLSQVLPPDLPTKVHHVSSSDGLSQASVRTIIKDQKGFIWLGTIDGLNRYDGKNIVQYRHNPKDKNSLRGNFISALLEDRKGRIWIGTINRGFCYYNPKKDIFINPKLATSFSEIMNASIVTNIEEDTIGNIWINTKKYGIIRISETKDGFFEATIVPIPKSNLITTALYISIDNKVWVGTENGEIFYATIENNKIPQFTSIENVKSTSRINCFVDDDKSIWVGTENGVWHIFKNNKKMSFYDLNTAGNLKTRKYYIYTIKFASPNELWVGSGNGLYRLQKKNKNSWFEQVSLYHEELDNLISNNTVYSLLPDQNLLWIGTAKNLDIFDFEKPKFQNISSQLNNKTVLSAYKENENLWLGTAGGLHLLTNKKVYLFKEEVATANSITDNIITSITPDNKGNLWLGTTKGISVIDLKYFKPNKPVFTTVYNNNSNKNLDDVTQVYIDRSEQVWFTTNGQGVKRFFGNIKNSDFQTQLFKHNPKDKNTISSNNVYCIAQDKNGDYWIGTQNGLDRLTVLSEDYTKFSIKKYKHQQDDTRTISSNSIKNIYFDKEGVMWVGTRFGFNKYDSKNDSFQSYYTSDGLPNELIYSMQEDNAENIWLGTNKGLSCFDKNRETFINFSVRDGLSDNEFNTLANFKDEKGKIYMGNINGITSFYPQDILKRKNPKNVMITEILKPKPIKRKSKNSINREMLRLNSLSESPIQLKYNDFPIYLKFASPESGPFEEPDYYYKLIPTDQDWNYLGERKEMQLLNLAPGNYSLLLAGGQNGEVWEEKTYKLQLEISPPWWKSIWAYLLYSLLFLFLIYSTYKFLLGRKLEHQENLRLIELDELKSKLYNNITHELRTPLTVIRGMTDTIIEKMDREQLAKFKTKFAVLSKNTEKLLFLINQMLNLSKIESGNMQLNLIQDDIIPYIKVNMDSFHSLATKNKIDLVFYDETKSLYMDFDPEKITIVISNLISNAIKFTNENGKISIHIHRIIFNNTACLILKVKDDGVGISAKDQKHIFDRFYQADRNLLTEGTGIGLSLTKEVVELMGGQVSVKSTLNKGSEFVVKIPISHTAEVSSQLSKPKIETVMADKTSKANEKLNNNEGLPLILIVEDNEDVAHFIASCLDKDYNIIFAKDGQEGITKAFGSIPDIIITDLMMPVIDGLELTKTLKKDERSSHIPIIMLTALSLEQDRLTGLKQGADAYLVKPFNKEELLIRVEQLIILRKKLQEHYSSQLSHNLLSDRANDKEASFLKKVIAIILKDLSNSQLNAQDISREIAMSESQLYRKLKAVSGKSTAVFIRYVRLVEAKKLLQTTDSNISEIAYDCGFNEPTWFSKAFKKEFGVRPRTIKKQ